MKAMARIVLALVALMTISACVVEEDGRGGGGYRGGGYGGGWGYGGGEHGYGDHDGGYHH